MSAREDSIDAAIAAITEKKYARAEAVLAALNDDPDRRSLRSLHLYAQVLEAQGRSAPVDSLMELARQVPANKIEEAYFFGEMASLLFRRAPGAARDLGKVAEYLDHALQLDSHPNNEMLLNNLCRAHFELGDYRKLVGYAELLLDFPDSRTRARLAVAHASLRLQEFDKAAAFLDGVLENIGQVDDSQLPWLIELLVLCRRAGDAQAVIDGLAERHYDGNVRNWFQAQVWFAQHRFDDTLALLSDEFCRSEVHDPGTRSKAFFMRGRCLDESGEYSSAYRAFDAMNREVRSRYRITAPPGPRYDYGGFDYASLPKHAADEAMPYTPTFLVGFPRSGTTLLETLLDSRDDVLTLSETRNLANARSLLRDWGLTYPQDLGALSAPQVREMRSAYFEHNSALIPAAGNPAAVIDKLPLNILHIPLILALFPQARFLLSLRHPLDAALSCFQQNFEMTAEMAHFTRLEDALARYANVMDQFDVFCAELEFAVLAIRYEELVADVERVMTSIEGFLGLEPGDTYGDFQQVGKHKPVLTPSGTQVSRDVYETSVGRWRNYADQVLPHASLVEAWTRRYESRDMPAEETAAGREQA